MNFFVGKLWLDLHAAIRGGPTRGNRHPRWMAYVVLVSWYPSGIPFSLIFEQFKPYILFIGFAMPPLSYITKKYHQLFCLVMMQVGAEHVVIDNFTPFAISPANFYCAVIGIHPM